MAQLDSTITKNELLIKLAGLAKELQKKDPEKFKQMNLESNMEYLDIYTPTFGDQKEAQQAEMNNLISSVENALMEAETKKEMPESKTIPHREKPFEGIRNLFK